MHAVFRETTYAPDQSLVDRPEFQEFQKAHASRRGYKGTIVADVGGGRFVTMTLWETADDMNAARQALGPVVERLLSPLMTSPSKLYGTGRVVTSDLIPA
jgi:hypothetical protein